MESAEAPLDAHGVACQMDSLAGASGASDEVEGVAAPLAARGVVGQMEGFAYAGGASG